jgi:hypothetical protein
MEEERIIVGRNRRLAEEGCCRGTGKLLLGVYFARFVNAIGRSSTRHPFVLATQNCTSLTIQLALGFVLQNE